MTADAGASGAERERTWRVTSGGCSEVGPIRTANEDHLLIDDDARLFIVADGMGGHQAGETASRLAVATVAEDLRPSAGSAAAGATGPAGSSAPNRVARALQRANEVVFMSGAADPALTGMGTTVTVLWLGTQDAVIGSVGDSRAYLIRGELTRQLTRDDTWLESMLGPDGARAAHARLHPMRHVLTHIIGSPDSRVPEVVSVSVEPGDAFVLTTDGVHNVVDDDSIGRLATSSAPALAARLLVDEALRCRATDNVTVVVVKVD